MLMKQLATVSNIYQLPNRSLTVFPTMSHHVQYWDVQLLTSPIPRVLIGYGQTEITFLGTVEAHILEFVPNHVCDGRQCYTKTDAKETFQSDILLLFPRTAIAGRDCTPAILLHPSEGLQFNDVCIVLHMFVEFWSETLNILLI